MEPKILNSLEPELYTHPLEIGAREKLLNTKGLKTVVNKFKELGFEERMLLQYKANSIKVTSHTLSHLHYLKEKVAATLNISQPIDLYIQRSDQLEGLSVGVDNPIIILPSDAIDTLSYQELLFLMGREMTHIDHQHTLYKEIGFIFPELMDAFSVVTLGISSLVGSGLKYALFNWDRMTEFTADRGGLLACQEPNIVLRLFAKLAGWPRSEWGNITIEEFKHQVNSFESGKQKTYDKVIHYMLGNNNWAIARAQELVAWIDKGSYQKLIG